MEKLPEPIDSMPKFTGELEPEVSARLKPSDREFLRMLRRQEERDAWILKQLIIAFNLSIENAKERRDATKVKMNFFLKLFWILLTALAGGWAEKYFLEGPKK